MGKKQRAREEKAEKRERRGAEKAQKDRNVKIGFAVGAGVIVVYVVALLSLSGASAPVELTVDGTSPSLREVFSGGEPWLVWCSDSSDGHDVSAMHSIVDQAAPLLMGVARVGILDCEEELPSGKTTYEKLHLDESSPTLFLAANGAAPRQLKAKNVKSANSIVKFVTKHAQPVLRRPTSADDLKDHCLGRKWCAVVLTDGRLRDEFKSDTNALMRNNRGVSFNAVDASKYRLSTEPKVLRKGEPSEDEPSMVVFNRWKNENGKAVTLARVHRGDLASGAEAMLEEAQVLKGNGRPGGSGWVTLSAPPRIFYRKGASKLEMGSDGADSSADDSGGAEEMSTWEEADEVAAEVSAKKKAEREQRKAEREEKRESEDDDREARRAARKAARAEKAEREAEEARAAAEEAEEARERQEREREAKRREEMEKEEQAQIFETVEDGEEDEDEDEEDDEEEEVVLLDDWDDDEL